jgi:peptidoglycan hydrolase CwlO-like protein
MKVVGLLVNQTNFVRQKQALASAEYVKSTSLLEELTKKKPNAAAEVEKLEQSVPTASTPTTSQAESRELAQLLRETRDAIRELPNRQYID